MRAPFRADFPQLLWRWPLPHSVCLADGVLNAKVELGEDVEAPPEPGKGSAREEGHGGGVVRAWIRHLGGPDPSATRGRLTGVRLAIGQAA